MAAATLDYSQPFPTWLEGHLKSLNEDVDSCLIDYIVGLLEDDEDEESLVEGLSGILESIVGDATTSTTSFIVSSWRDYKNNRDSAHDIAPAKQTADNLFESALATALEKQSIVEAKPQRKLTKDDEDRLKVKEAILNLAAASAAEDQEEEGEDEVEDAGVAPNASLIPENVNVQKVLDEQKEKRDSAAKQAEAKKAKDKEDREKQKNQKQEKADSEKKRTQKGERRR